MQTIIVTGGAGFIGSNFVRLALTKRNWRVIVIDKLTYAGSLLNLREVEDDSRYSFIQADIADQSAVTAAFEDFQNRLAMVSYEQPIADIPSVAIKRKSFGREGVGDCERYELFGILIEAVVIGAMRSDCRQAKGFMVSTDKMIGRGFGSRIRRVRRIGRYLAEETFVA